MGAKCDHKTREYRLHQGFLCIALQSRLCFPLEKEGVIWARKRGRWHKRFVAFCNILRREISVAFVVQVGFARSNRLAVIHEASLFFSETESGAKRIEENR